MAKIEKNKIFDLPIFLLTKATECPYISNKIEKRLATDITNNSHLHDELALSGFRRVENWMYRPACDSCNECKAYRIKVKEFDLSKSFKRTTKKNNNLSTKVVKNKALKKHFTLFKKYQNDRHFAGSMSKMSFEDFKSMIEISPINTNLIEYKDKNNKLIAVMLFDTQKDGLSAVYSFYKPEYKKNSIGIYMILHLIEMTKLMKLKYLYLGYFIKNVDRMNYKVLFSPGEIFENGKWNVLDV